MEPFFEVALDDNEVTEIITLSPLEGEEEQFVGDSNNQRFVPEQEPEQPPPTKASVPALPAPVTPTDSYLNSEESMFFRQKNKSYVYEETEPVLSDFQRDDDERSFVGAQNAEQILNGALLHAEKQHGCNILQITRSATRLDTVEFGRQITILSSESRPPSVLQVMDDDDNASVHSWASQITETTFIKIPKQDPSISRQRSLEQVRAFLKDANLGADDDTLDDEPVMETPSQPVVSEVPRDILPPNRNWDKLRDRLEAEDNESALSAEDYTDAPAKKRHTSPLRRVGRSFHKSIQKLRRSVRKREARDFSMTLGAVPSKKETAANYAVSIRVEDLSKAPEEATVVSDDQDTSLDTDYQDPVEAESLEVVYVSSASDNGVIDVLPPFPSRMVKHQVAH
eukprot:Nitzschia sp. Nitz4//scaffold8_size234185//165124//166314//NITZ4_001280-RA/size234185-processed-gene-0.167-mRNA-1//-1//CDS//3329559875//3468//frame0